MLERANSAGITLVTAPAGAGKSTWSLASALRYASTRPVIWMQARSLMSADVDSLAAVVMKIADLPQLISQRQVAEAVRDDRRLLLLFVDGIDEARDYDKLGSLLTDFQASPLAEVTQLVLLCRTEGVPAFSDILPRRVTELSNQTRSGNIVLDDLTNEEATEILIRSGASRGEIRIIEHWLPSDLRRKPLFLLTTLLANRRSPLHTGGQRDVVAALATHYVDEIARRLTRDGRRPADFVVRAFLENVALECLRSASGGVPAEGWAVISGGADDGENSPRRRAIQSGILVEDAGGTTTYAHGVFLEHFAVSALTKIPISSWIDRMPSLVTERGRGITLRLVSALPDAGSLVDLLLAHDERLACEVAAHARSEIGEAQQARIIESLERGLRSRFPSERQRALRLLGGMMGRRARNAAAAWWNGLGSAKQNEVFPAAETFLKLQMAEAAEIILLHPRFHSAQDLPWFEPAFVQVIHALPTEFNERLRSVARNRLAGLDPRTDAAAPYVQALAILGDGEHLTETLRRALGQGTLSAICHRALIFINTDESLAVFRDSVDLQIEWLRAHPEISDEEHETAWDALVLNGTDTAMYPHECLVTLVEAALESPRRAHNWFGLRWSEFIPNLRLLQPCADALQRQHDLISMTSRAIEKILRISNAEDVLAAFEQGNPQLQRLIVHNLHHVPCVQTELFLIKCLDCHEHRFSAIQSLGLLRSVRGAAAIRHWLRNGDRRTKATAARAIGRIRDIEAVPDLADSLEGAESLADLEYALVEALGWIGGDDAIGRLAQAYSRCRNKEHVLRQILRTRSQTSILAVRALVGIGDGPLIVAALARRHRDELDSINDKVQQPWIKDDALCSYVLAEAEKVIRTRPPDLLANPIRALAAFDLRQAHQFLEEAAALGPLQEPGEPLRMARDPVREARNILASRGHRTYARLTLENELARITIWGGVSERDLHNLRPWPPSLVREVLLEQLASKPSATLITVFSWFAGPADRTNFERWENLSDVPAADAAHEYLVSHPG